MMAGNSPFILLNLVRFPLLKIVEFRTETGVPVCFTLDAGPNVHLLYPSNHADAVMEWFRP